MSQLHRVAVWFFSVDCNRSLWDVFPYLQLPTKQVASRTYVFLGYKGLTVGVAKLNVSDLGHLAVAKCLGQGK